MKPTVSPTIKSPLLPEPEKRCKHFLRNPALAGDKKFSICQGAQGHGGKHFIQIMVQW